MTNTTVQGVLYDVKHALNALEHGHDIIGGADFVQFHAALDGAIDLFEKAEAMSNAYELAIKDVYMCGMDALYGGGKDQAPDIAAGGGPEPLGQSNPL